MKKIPTPDPSRLLNTGEYLAEMGWELSKNGMAYAWIEQAIKRQRDLTASIYQKKLDELGAKLITTNVYYLKEIHSLRAEIFEELEEPCPHWKEVPADHLQKTILKRDCFLCREVIQKGVVKQ